VRSKAAAGALLFILLSLPPLRHALEASMTAQMLLQIPLLCVVGWLAADALPARFRAHLDRFNEHGLTGLVLATVAGACWMLPRALDAGATDPLVAAAKYVSVPLLIGLPLAISRPRMGFVVTGVFLAEVIASCFRLGWLYEVSPVRLCSRYLLEDQQRLGMLLLAVGTLLLAGVAWKLVWGRFDAPAKRHGVASGYHRASARRGI
jgi:hypothetical protein